MRNGNRCRRGGQRGYFLIVLSHFRTRRLSPPNASPYRPATPFRQMATPNGQDVHISRGIRPFPPIVLAGGVGWRGEKKLDSRVLLALRQLTCLAERGCRWVFRQARICSNQRWMSHLRECVRVAKTLGPSRKSCRTGTLGSRSTLPTNFRIWQSGKDTFIRILRWWRRISHG
jgi:hypothetical protein